MSGPWQAGMLSCCYSFWGMLLLPGIDSVSKSLLPSSSLSWFSFNLSIVFGSFWPTSLFLQVSSLVIKIKDLRGNRGLPLPALLAKTFNCCDGYCLVEVGDHEVQISIFIYQRSKRCNKVFFWQESLSKSSILIIWVKLCWNFQNSQPKNWANSGREVRLGYIP